MFAYTYDSVVCTYVYVYALVSLILCVCVGSASSEPPTSHSDTVSTGILDSGERCMPCMCTSVEERCLDGSSAVEHFTYVCTYVAQ